MILLVCAGFDSTTILQHFSLSVYLEEETLHNALHRLRTPRRKNSMHISSQEKITNASRPNESPIAVLSSEVARPCLFPSYQRSPAPKNPLPSEKGNNNLPLSCHLSYSEACSVQFFLPLHQFAQEMDFLEAFLFDPAATGW
jgi:hypothetical protein